MQSDNSLSIRTPEGVTFKLTLAGPTTRFLAFAIDLSAITLLSGLIGMVLRLFWALNGDAIQALVILSYFIVSIGYSIVLEWVWRGQTIGKRVLNLRVVDADGLRLTPAQIVVRNLLRFADLLPFFYVVGGCFCLFTRRFQRLGDIAANTVVIYERPEKIPDFELILSGSYNSLRAYPHLAARLRQLVEPDEARLALEAVGRRDELNAAARIELFREFGDHFRSMIEFPLESLEGLTDEQYVRNIVDLIYRPGAMR
jgi:uncharacterized RDD family membrane protein YckC